MKKVMVSGALISAFALQACAPASTPQQQAQREHEFACTAGSIGGALIGGLIGNQFGGGSGRTIMTAGGAVAGASVAASYEC